MSGDYSRVTFDPVRDDLGVLLQQGRPLSDADWNDLVMQLRRRIHAGTLDTIGKAVVPTQTPDAFRIAIVPGNLEIGRGRMYVDGILAENHGGPEPEWHATLEEMIGQSPLHYRSQPGLAAQPYDPNPPPLPAGGPHLVYLDVWQREITHLMRDGLVEKAVGVDSSTRLQTVWQVKLLNVGPAGNCASDLDALPLWAAAHPRCGGRLTTTTAVVPGQPDPCLVAPAGGYKGLENQLYRVEIHRGGLPGTATFKWSRDNASVETRVTHLPALDQLTVEQTQKDDVLRFSDGDWIEITDDWLELHGRPGELRRIRVGNGVDDATRTILLETPLPAGLFPVDGQDRPDPARHTRIKRWDQRGQVLDQNGNVLADIDDAPANGEITIPTGVATSVLLEHGIVARFSVDPLGGEFRSGDYWVFTARAGDASIEELEAAPPRGIHHHYAKLGFVTFPGTITDCRVFWPPPMGGGDDCSCTVCVSPEDHASGALTIQAAVNQVIASGGGTVCLDVGDYPLAAPVLIRGTRDVHIIGKGVNTVVRPAAGQGAFDIQRSRDVSLERFSIDCDPGNVTAPAQSINVFASHFVCLEKLDIDVPGTAPNWAAINLAESLTHLRIADNTILAPVGIRGGATASGAGVGLADTRIEGNDLDCTLTAISFTPTTAHQFLNHIAGNRIKNCTSAAIRLTGLTAPDFGLDIRSNVIQTRATGIETNLNGVRIIGNDILGSAEPVAGAASSGIALPAPAVGTSMTECLISGNRIEGFNRAGIRVIAAVRSLKLVGNQIARVAFGIEIEVRNPGIEQLAIENNQFSELTLGNGRAIMAEGLAANYIVSGNQIRVRTSQHAVSMQFENGDGTFVNNQCYREGGSEAVADVRLQAATVIVSNNRILGGLFSLQVVTAAGRNTAVGNVCRGSIQGVTAAFAALNLTGF
jgi:hypothetical protein